MLILYLGGAAPGHWEEGIWEVKQGRRRSSVKWSIIPQPLIPCELQRDTAIIQQVHLLFLMGCPRTGFTEKSCLKNSPLKKGRERKWICLAACYSLSPGVVVQPQCINPPVPLGCIIQSIYQLLKEPRSRASWLDVSRESRVRDSRGSGCAINQPYVAKVHLRSEISL